MDLSNMTRIQLESLQTLISEEIKGREKRGRKEAIDTIFRLAHDLGLPVADLLPSAREEGPRKAYKQRGPGQHYVDPKNPDNVWRGAGPRPKWLKDAISAGVDLAMLKAA